MSIFMPSEVRKNFFKVIENVAESNTPILVKGKKKNVLIVSEQDWEDLQETLCVKSHPELEKSLIEGLNTPFEDCSTELDYYTI